MAAKEGIQPAGEKLRRAVCWVSECLQEYPNQERKALIREAETRFDLSPAECEFLDQNFG